LTKKQTKIKIKIRNKKIRNKKKPKGKTKKPNSFCTQLAHAPVLVDGKEVGQLSSGGWSPTLKKAIGMGYLPTQYSAVGTPLEVVVRNKKYPAAVTKMPHVPTQFYKGP
jgi:glycine cleavage system aminomethyltransferase T